MYLVIKVFLSAIIIVTISEIAKRSPTLGALIASLPLVSILGMVWLWHDTHDPVRLAAHAQATFWYVLPSLPMFILLPIMLRLGVEFYIAMIVSCAVTVALYLAMIFILKRFGIVF